MLTLEKVQARFRDEPVFFDFLQDGSKRMRRFFIPSEHLKFPVSVLTGSDLNHLKKVLRLKPGDLIALFDGAGTECTGRIVGISSSEAVVEIVGKEERETEEAVRIVIAQAFLKDKKMDSLARGLTELGIHRWEPFFSDRSIPNPDRKRLASRAARWEKIIREAVKQCGRTRLMEIGPAVSYGEALRSGSSADLKIIFWENAAEPLSEKKIAARGQSIRSVHALIGPEGGFSQKEAERAVEEGFEPVGMGRRILRAETAALAAATLLQYLFGDMGENLP